MTDWANIAEKMRLVASDCEADAVRVDSTPFTPRGVGSRLGEHLAMIKAVATATALVAEDLEKQKRPEGAVLAASTGPEGATTCFECGRDLHGYQGPRCRYCDGTAE